MQVQLAEQEAYFPTLNMWVVQPRQPPSLANKYPLNTER